MNMSAIRCCDDEAAARLCHDTIVNRVIEK